LTFVTVDELFIIAGDVQGVIFLAERKTGELVHMLNQIDENIPQVSSFLFVCLF